MGSTWAKLIIKLLWKYRYIMWKIRNNMMYTKPSQEQPKQRIRRQKVQVLYEENKKDKKLAPEIYKYGLQELQRKPKQYIKLWIEKAEMLKERLRVLKKKQENRGQDIRKYGVNRSIEPD